MTQLVVNGARVTVLQLLYENDSDLEALLATEDLSKGVLERNATVHRLANGQIVKCKLLVFPLENSVVIQE